MTSNTNPLEGRIWIFITAVVIGLLVEAICLAFLSFGNLNGAAYDVFIEFQGMLFDVILFGIILTVYEGRRMRIENKRRVEEEAERERQQKIDRYNEEIEDYLGWESDEAKFRIVGLIKRLNKLGEAPVNLEQAYLVGANLVEANLEGANLEFSNLSGAKLGAANLSNAKLDGSVLRGAFLPSANLSKSSLSSVDASKANFCHVNLSGASLYSAKFFEANLAHARLTGADLGNANLECANLFDVDLHEARIFSASLNGANFIGPHFRSASKLGNNHYFIPLQFKVKNIMRARFYKVKIHITHISELRQHLTHEQLKQIVLLKEWPETTRKEPWYTDDDYVNYDYTDIW